MSEEQERMDLAARLRSIFTDEDLATLELLKGVDPRAGAVAATIASSDMPEDVKRVIAKFVADFGATPMAAVSLPEVRERIMAIYRAAPDSESAATRLRGLAIARRNNPRAFLPRRGD